MIPLNNIQRTATASAADSPDLPGCERALNVRLHPAVDAIRAHGLRSILTRLGVE
jgi:hypothetical protein